MVSLDEAPGYMRSSQLKITKCRLQGTMKESQQKRQKITVELEFSRNSVVVQWLVLSIVTAKGSGSIPGRGTKISQAT